MTVRPPTLERPTEAEGPASPEVLFKEARRRRRRRWAIGASAVLAVGALGAALGAGSLRPGRPSPRPPSTGEATSSPKQAALPPRPACNAAQLDARYEFGGVGMGNVSDDVVLTNTGAPCRLSGYATLVGIRADGSRVPLAVEKHGTYFGNLHAATLGTGKHGLLLLGTEDGCTAIASPNPAADAADKVASTYSQLVVVLPKTTGSVTVPGATIDVACGISESQLGVRPPAYGAPLGTPGTLTATMSAPTSVKAGGVLRYTITLFDFAPKRVVLRSCPRYSASISKLTGFLFKRAPGTKTLLLRKNGVLPCAHRRVIARHHPQTFPMAISVPAVRTIMTAVVSWRLEVPSEKSIEPSQILSVESSTRPSAVAGFLCQGAFGRRLVSSTPGTVGTVGAVRRLVAGAFVGYAPSHAVAWCWTGRAHLYKLYAVAPEYEPVFVKELAGPHATIPPRPATRRASGRRATGGHAEVMGGAAG